MYEKCCTTAERQEEQREGGIRGKYEGRKEELVVEDFQGGCFGIERVL